MSPVPATTFVERMRWTEKRITVHRFDGVPFRRGPGTLADLSPVPFPRVPSISIDADDFLPDDETL